MRRMTRFHPRRNTDVTTATTATTAISMVSSSRNMIDISNIMIVGTSIITLTRNRSRGGGGEKSKTVFRTIHNRSRWKRG